jgi:hypothetical protein
VRILAERGVSKLKENKFWKIGFILLFMILLVGVAYFAYSYGRGKTEEGQTKTSDLTATISPSQEVGINEEGAVKEAVYRKFGSDATKLVVIVSEVTDGFAKGGVREVSSEVGGGYFIAAKTEGSWVVVYDGQAQPTCNQIAPYNFPKEMVPECLDSKGGVVKR